MKTNFWERNTYSIIFERLPKETACNCWLAEGWLLGRLHFVVFFSVWGLFFWLFVRFWEGVASIGDVGDTNWANWGESICLFGFLGICSEFSNINGDDISALMGVRMLSSKLVSDPIFSSEISKESYWDLSIGLKGNIMIWVLSETVLYFCRFFL